MCGPLPYISTRQRIEGQVKIAGLSCNSAHTLGRPWISRYICGGVSRLERSLSGTSCPAPGGNRYRRRLRRDRSSDVKASCLGLRNNHSEEVRQLMRWRFFNKLLYFPVACICGMIMKNQAETRKRIGGMTKPTVFACVFLRPQLRPPDKLPHCSRICPLYASPACLQVRCLMGPTTGLQQFHRPGRKHRTTILDFLISP